MSVSPALIAMHRHPQCGRAGGAGVGDVVDGDPGLADLLLEHLPDRCHRHHQVAGADDADVLHGHAAVGQRAQRPPRRPDRRCPCRGACRTWSCGCRGSRHLLRCRCHRAQPPRGSKPKPMASVPSSSVPMTSVASRTFMPSVTCSGSARHVDEVGPHAGALAVDDGGHERHRDPGGGEGHDREGPHLARRGDVRLRELRSVARRTGVAAVEVARPARGALVGHQVRVVTEDQVVDQRDLLRHHAPGLRWRIMFSG